MKRINEGRETTQKLFLVAYFKVWKSWLQRSYELMHWGWLQEVNVAEWMDEKFLLKKNPNPHKVGRHMLESNRAVEQCVVFVVCL